MNIKTELLQKMVAKAIQGASMNKMIPLTSLIGIEFKENILGGNGNLILTTTDGSTQLKINQEVEGNGEFYTIVNADTFAKLVGKTTKATIELENKENYLLFTGNGDYKLEIAINEEGEMVKFPEVKNIDVAPYSISTKLLQDAIRTTKASVAKTMEIPCLTGYYLGDSTTAIGVIGTDRQLICTMNNTLVKEPMLISSEMAELLLLVEEETTNVLQKDNDIIFFNKEFTIAGKELEGKENYPVEQITGLLDTQYNNSIKVNKDELLSVLDRLSLFISDYDKNGIKLAFTKEAILAKSQKSNAQELIDAESTSEEEFDVLVDIEMLRSQIETISTDIVEIHYGQEK